MGSPESFHQETQELTSWDNYKNDSLCCRHREGDLPEDGKRWICHDRKLLLLGAGEMWGSGLFFVPFSIYLKTHIKSLNNF